MFCLDFFTKFKAIFENNRYNKISKKKASSNLYLNRKRQKELTDFKIFKCIKDLLSI